jgi:alkylated DNA repair protein (DNA oxidative demethylase)
MPEVFCRLATEAAAKAGFLHVIPDACLINQYKVGGCLSLHQDENERDFSMPIVSVSLGMSAVFLFGGHRREDKTVRVPLSHGDTVVWGGVDRMRFHGVMPLDGAPHPTLGEQRINLTFRKAG